MRNATAKKISAAARATIPLKVRAVTVSGTRVSNHKVAILSPTKARAWESGVVVVGW